MSDLSGDMGIILDVNDWQEPMTGAVSVEYHPVDYSCDNGIAFTAYMQGLLGRSGTIPTFDAFLLQYEDSPGVLKRHPTSSEVTSWDDHLAAAAKSPFMAQRILAYGEANKWEWGGKWLGRFPLFIPTVRAGAGKPLSILHKLLASAAYLANVFEPYEKTSGKLSLWIASQALQGAPMKGFNWVIKLWGWAQKKRYMFGLHGVMAIYFQPKNGVHHPFDTFSANLLEFID